MTVMVYVVVTDGCWFQLLLCFLLIVFGRVPIFAVEFLAVALSL